MLIAGVFLRLFAGILLPNGECGVWGSAPSKLFVGSKAQVPSVRAQISLEIRSINSN